MGIRKSIPYSYGDLLDIEIPDLFPGGRMRGRARALVVRNLQPTLCMLSSILETVSAVRASSKDLHPEPP